MGLVFQAIVIVIIVVLANVFRVTRTAEFLSAGHIVMQVFEMLAILYMLFHLGKVLFEDCRKTLTEDPTMSKEDKRNKTKSNYSLGVS